MRVFIAINLPPKVKQDIARLIGSLGKQASALRWLDQTLWHLTLVFLGEISPDQLSQAEIRLQDLLEPISPFTLSLQNMIGFPSLRNPSIVGLGVKTNQKLAELVEQFRSELKRLQIGKIESRKFQPHITIARNKSGVGDLSSWEGQGLASNWTVNSIEVMQSILNPEGAQYQLLKSFSLK
ncbi:MAG: RNA 2',3'-cyclic phosphodiesterase [Patescibacteria group bacterium]